MSEQSFWDKEAIYDEKISPLMAQIIALCNQHGIPVVARFQICDTEESGPGYCTTVIPGEGQSEEQRQLGHTVGPRRPVAWTETHVTNPDGSKVITIGKLL